MPKKPAIILFALCILGVIFFGWLAFSQQIPTKEIVKTLPSQTPVAIPTATPTPYSGPVAMTVATTATMKWSPVLEPSDFVNIFQLVDPAKGFYASGETTYLITHSYAAGSGAPGNAWEKLVVGNVVEYDNHFYEINRVSTPAQGDISEEPIWTNDPNMLVMITCVSRGPGNPATNNYVLRLEKIGT